MTAPVPRLSPPAGAAARSASHPASRGAPGAASRSVAPPGAANRIVVVDDDDAVCAVLCEAAEEVGYAALGARDRTEFLAALEAFTPTVVVLDLTIPGTDGVELLRDLEGLAQRPRIILASGQDERLVAGVERLARMRGLAVAGTLLKPVRLPELWALLEEARGTDAAELAAALENGELELFFQPKIDLAGDSGGAGSAGIADAGEAGDAGRAGTAGAAGGPGTAGGTGGAGTAVDAGEAGTAGDAGEAGTAGGAGEVGTAGGAGEAGTAGGAGGPGPAGGAERAGGGRRVVGAEALLRWRHPSRGIVGPGEFIPLAESSGLISPITEFVVRSVARQAKAWHGRGIAIPIALNFSPTLMNDLGWPDRIGAILAAEGVETSAIIVEITESAAMDDPKKALEIAARLRLRSIALSLDDFGAGYSSVVELYRLPLQELKLDRSLIADMEHDGDARTVVSALVALARALGMSTCAEGVESPAAEEFLRSIGCDAAQGFLYSKPVPAAAFEAYVLEQRARHG